MAVEGKETMSMKLAERFFIVGAGRHAQVVLAAWQAGCCSDFDFHCFLGQKDVDTAESLGGHPIRWQTSEVLQRLKEEGVEHFAFGLGTLKSNEARATLFEFFVDAGFLPLTLIHPSAYVAEQAELKEGVYVGANAVIQPFAKVSKAAIVNTGAIIEHHAELGYNTHVAPGSIVCGQVKIGAHSMIGAGSVVIQSLMIGENVTVGAGSVITRDIPNGQTVLAPRTEILLPVAQA